MIKPMSCNKGFKSCPSNGLFGSTRSNGLEVNNVNSKKPTPIMPITARALAKTSKGKFLEKILTANVQPESSNTHSKREPSWLPHTADILY